MPHRALLTIITIQTVQLDGETRKPTATCPGVNRDVQRAIHLKVLGYLDIARIDILGNTIPTVSVPVPQNGVLDEISVAAVQGLRVYTEADARSLISGGRAFEPYSTRITAEFIIMQSIDYMRRDIVCATTTSVFVLALIFDDHLSAASEGVAEEG